MISFLLVQQSANLGLQRQQLGVLWWGLSGGRLLRSPAPPFPTPRWSAAADSSAPSDSRRVEQRGGAGPCEAW